MKKKTQVLLSSVAAIAMSASLCAGATYALFTSESAVNVSVSSGKVKMTATVEEGSIKTSSTVNHKTWTDENAADGYQFENNGVATLTPDGNVVLTGMTPGDKVEFNIQIDDESTVTAKYRTVVIPTADNGLLSGLKITIDDTTFVGAAVSDWANTEDKTVSVSIELPEEAGNEYQGKTVSLTYLVEAIQGNASVNNGDVQDEDDYYLISSVTDLWRMSAQIANGDTVAAARNYRLAADLNLNGAPFMAIGTKDNQYCGKFDGNGKTISNFTVTSTETAGLFGYVGDGPIEGNIEKLTVKNATITGTHYVGGIVGKIWGGVQNCRVENVTVTATLNAKGMDGDKAGGVIGWGDNGQYTGNYVKNVTVTAFRDLGGVIGCALDESPAEVITVSGNTVEKLTIAYLSGPNTYIDENGNQKKQENLDPICGRTSGPVLVKEDNKIISVNTSNNAVLSAVSTTEELVNAIDNAKDNVATTIYMNAGTYTKDYIEIGENKQITLKAANGVASDKVVFDGQFEVPGSLTIEGITLTNKNAKVHTDSKKNGVSIYVRSEGTVECVGVTFNVKKTTAITSWDSPGRQRPNEKFTNVIVRDCTFNCNGNRALQIDGNATIEGCTFYDQYRYAVQLTCGNVESEMVVINFNNNIIIDGGKTSREHAYGVQLTNDYGNENMLITCSGNVIVNADEDDHLYVYETGTGTNNGKVDLDTINFSATDSELVALTTND